MGTVSVPPQILPVQLSASLEDGQIQAEVGNGVYETQYGLVGVGVAVGPGVAVIIGTTIVGRGVGGVVGVTVIKVSDLSCSVFSGVICAEGVTGITIFFVADNELSSNV